jgi:peptide/nickel transport system substrate-binding protein
VVKYAQDQAMALSLTTLDAKALTTYIANLAAFYAKTANTQLDLTAALSAKDALDSLAGELTNIAGMSADADKQAEIVSFAENFIGQQVTDSTWSLGLRDYSTAKTMSTVVYPSTLFQTKWHDGSNLSVADFVMNMIMVFEPAKPASKIFDPAEVPGFQSFMSTFKGVRITSTDPLTIETYSDSYALDAELSISTWYPAAAGSYGFGTAAWHNLTPSILAEADGKLAFSNDKSQSKSVEWTSLIAGPSLATQKTYLDQALKSAYIPYAPTLGQYITAADATARYTNLEKWYTAHGHLWIGTGPYYVDKVFPVEGTISLKRFASFPDPANRWSSFGQPMLATAAVDGPGIVPVGSDATFDVTITNNNKPYLNSDIDTVAYLVFDDKGAVIAQGNATPVADGHYQVTLSNDVTAKFVAGSDKLQVVVTSKVVSLPAFVTFEFVTQ